MINEPREAGAATNLDTRDRGASCVTERVTVYVALVDEGVECWRPVEATFLGDGVYRIESDNTDPEDEKWAFQRGDVVRCRMDAAGPVAVEKVAGRS